MVVTIEQVEQDSNVATPNDARQMLGYARAGLSARNYVYDKCTSAKYTNDGLEVIVSFTVTNDTGKPVVVTSTKGQVSAAQIKTVPNDDYIVFRNEDTASLPPGFSGDLIKEISFFNSWGEEIFPTISTEGSQVKLSEPAYGVLRRKGNKTITTYYLKLRVDDVRGKSSDAILSELNGATVTAHSDEKAHSLSVAIPECVTEIVCAGFIQEFFTLNDTDDDNMRHRVYYSTCDGSILREEDYDAGEPVYPGPLTQEEELALFKEHSGRFDD